MESKLLKISMNANSKEKAEQLIDYMKLNLAYPKDEMQQKGYYWDSVFYASEQNNEYLYIVVKSEDFSKIMLDESNLIETPFRAIYEKFRQECWNSDSYMDIEALHCFNSAIDIK